MCPTDSDPELGELVDKVRVQCSRSSSSVTLCYVMISCLFTRIFNPLENSPFDFCIHIFKIWLLQLSDLGCFKHFFARDAFSFD